MALSIVELKKGQTIDEFLTEENPKNFTLKIYPPVTIRYQGKIQCGHRVGVALIEDPEISTWIHSSYTAHDELTPEACARAVAVLSAKITQNLVNGEVRQSIIDKKNGVEHKKKETDGEELEKLLEAAI